MPRISKLKTLFAAFAAAAMFVACGGQMGPETTAEASAPPPPEVTVLTLHRQSLPQYLDFVGGARAVDTVEIRARIEGFIEKRLFEAGDAVKAGQLLYLVDDRTYQADLAEAQATLADAEAQLEKARENVELLRAEAELAEAQAGAMRAGQDVERLRPLAKEEAVSEQDLDAAEAAIKVADAQVRAKQAETHQQRLTQKTDIDRARAGVERAKAALRRAELNLGWTKIVAPVSGRIGESRGQVGALVTPSAAQPLTEISPLNPISVSFQVSERDYLRHFGAGENAAIKATFDLVLADGTPYPHKGKFRSAERALDTETGTLQLTADFPNPNGALLPGQFARVRLAVGEREGVFLAPQKAVQQMQGMRSVFVVDANDTVLMRTISVGEQQGENWVVHDGLEDGDRVIVEGVQFVRPGAKVKPVEAGAAPPPAPAE